MSVKPGQSTFCRKCNTDYSAEQIGQMLLNTELSGDFIEDEPPLDKSIQRRIMLNYLEKRKRDLEWKRKRRFMLTNLIGITMLSGYYFAIKIYLFGVTPWTIIFGIIMWVLCSLTSGVGYEWWLKNFNDRPLKRPEDGVFFLPLHEFEISRSADEPCNRLRIFQQRRILYPLRTLQ